MTITHRIDLAVTILDSATGRPADGFLRLNKNGKELKYRNASDGLALLIDISREDFELEVIVSGFEPETVTVTYADLDEQIPAMEVSLIPQDSFGEAYLTIDGSLKGLIAVDAVRVAAPSFIAQAIDERKRLLTVNSLYNQVLPGRRYGIVSKDETRFEAIEIIKITPEGAYKLAKIPDVQVSGLHLAYRVTGRVRDGTCLLRLPNDDSNASWILRSVTAAGDSYRTFVIGDIEVGAEGKRIGIDAIMKPKPKARTGTKTEPETDASAVPDQNESNEQTAKAKGG
ncbi:MAG: hypothetical protein LBN36_02380 [Clostridiales Family XIII bacterium]|nr:hypothetical protein [Clostridiales Family XIII bacterium]